MLAGEAQLFARLEGARLALQGDAQITFEHGQTDLPSRMPMWRQAAVGWELLADHLGDNLRWDGHVGSPRKLNWMGSVSRPESGIDPGAAPKGGRAHRLRI